MYLFQYDGKEYRSEQAVRTAIMKAERKIFEATPNDEVEEFWAMHGVTLVDNITPIETLRTWKHNAIKNAFLIWRESQATLVSSLGFKADSNERANTDVSGLLVAYEDNQDALITFRDADNEFHSLTYAQVKTLRKEIIENGNHAYAQKWAFDVQVEKAMTKEDLDAIEIKFEGKNFLEG